MITQSARGMIHLHQPPMEIERIDWTHHDASSTAVAPILVHLKQVSSGRHEHHEGALVHGFHVLLHV